MYFMFIMYHWKNKLTQIILTRLVKHILCHICYSKDILAGHFKRKKYIKIPRSQTRRTIKTQNPKDKTITWSKETQMTGQHEHLWKPEVKSGALEG